MSIQSLIYYDELSWVINDCNNAMINQLINKSLTDDYLTACSVCKKIKLGEQYYALKDYLLIDDERLRVSEIIDFDYYKSNFLLSHGLCENCFQEQLRKIDEFEIIQ